MFCLLLSAPHSSRGKSAQFEWISTLDLLGGFAWTRDWCGNTFLGPGRPLTSFGLISFHFSMAFCASAMLSYLWFPKFTLLSHFYIFRNAVPSIRMIFHMPCLLFTPGLPLLLHRLILSWVTLLGLSLFVPSPYVTASLYQTADSTSSVHPHSSLVFPHQNICHITLKLVTFITIL